MLGGIGDMISGLFVKKDGSMNWTSIIGIGAGAALGGFGGLGFIGLEAGSFLSILAGAGIGLGGSALVSSFMPGGEEKQDVKPNAGLPGKPAPKGDGVAVVRPSLPFGQGAGRAMA